MYALWFLYYAIWQIAWGTFVSACSSEAPCRHRRPVREATSGMPLMRFAMIDRILS